MLFWAVTAGSTAGTFLQSTQFAPYIPAFFAVGGLGTLLFTWAYDRFQVMNKQQKWNADRSNNFMGPAHAMNHKLDAVKFAVLSQSIKEDWDMEKTKQEMERVTDEKIKEYRNGIDLGDLE